VGCGCVCICDLFLDLVEGGVVQQVEGKPGGTWEVQGRGGVHEAGNEEYRKGQDHEHDGMEDDERRGRYHTHDGTEIRDGTVALAVAIPIPPPSPSTSSSMSSFPKRTSPPPPPLHIPASGFSHLSNKVDSTVRGEATARAFPTVTSTGQVDEEDVVYYDDDETPMPSPNVETYAGRERQVGMRRKVEAGERSPSMSWIRSFS